MFLRRDLALYLIEYVLKKREIKINGIFGHPVGREVLDKGHK